MRWGKKQQQQQQQQEEEEQKKQPSSPFLPFSWLSKLKRMATKKRSCGPEEDPAPARSPPAPSRSGSTHHRLPFVPGRLSVGEDDTLLARERTAHYSRSLLRSARHNSIGADIDWHRLPLSFHSDSDDIPPRRRPKELESVDTNLKPIDTVDRRRKSIAIKKKRRNRNMPKVRVYSPRPPAAPRKRVAAAPAPAPAAREGLEGFAVVKRSCDPQRDFRESMEEMIWERGMGRPEELERLLACYLSLNSDEHHDVIVKVFRQVWFDLNPSRFAAAAAPPVAAASGGWIR